MEHHPDEPSTSSCSSSAFAISRRRIAFRQPVAPLVAPSPSSSIDPDLSESDNNNQLNDSGNDSKSNEPPKRKAWSFEEVCAFYEGIKIHGKDFDSVVKAMSKRKVEKTKEHVKTFFFNSAKAYKQMLAITDDEFLNVPRDARELFLLVNACEWKRKTANMKVNVEKLKELLFDGNVNVKVGRKVVNIKTPPCPALCRYFISACRKADKIPSEMFVHLEPTSNEDHVLMRNRNHNPFLRIKLNPNDRISKLLEFLHKKWEAPSSAPFSVTIWPDSSCEVASLTVHTVETSPFITLSLNKLMKNIDEVKERAEPKKTQGAPQMALEANTIFPETKPTHELLYPRPFTLTDGVIAEGITLKNVKNAIMAELFCVCGRKNPIQLRYQIHNEHPMTDRLEPWKVMIDLLNRGYGDCLTGGKDAKGRKRGYEMGEPSTKRRKPDESKPSDLLPPESAPTSDIVRQENEEFESQLALLRRTSRQKTIPSKRKSTNPVLATGTPQLSIRPAISPSFTAPTCTIVPKKSTVKSQGKSGKRTENSMNGEKKPPIDFSSVSFSPMKRNTEMEIQKKRTEEFLSSLRTPNDTPVQTPRKLMMQQLFGDELSMSPNSTRHASHLESHDGANTSVVDFTDMMYQHIKDHGDTTVSNPALDFSVSEVQQTYHDMMSSSQNSHDFLFGQFQKKRATPKKRK